MRVHCHKCYGCGAQARRGALPGHQRAEDGKGVVEGSAQEVGLLQDRYKKWAVIVKKTLTDTLARKVKSADDAIMCNNSFIGSKFGKSFGRDVEIASLAHKDKAKYNAKGQKAVTSLALVAKQTCKEGSRFCSCMRQLTLFADFWLMAYMGDSGSLAEWRQGLDKKIGPLEDLCVEFWLQLAIEWLPRRKEVVAVLEGAKSKCLKLVLKFLKSKHS
mmetsp:Transcript_111576/g.322487  ORF Transcript_111576/g.322487 Transcript_111576/m.322487 type:complete len:216 (+) Transcript_111576:416-1063(+)